MSRSRCISVVGAQAACRYLPRIVNSRFLDANHPYFIECTPGIFEAVQECHAEDPIVIFICKVSLVAP